MMNDKNSPPILKTLIILLMILLFLQNLEAFTLLYDNESHFETNEITIDVTDDDCANAGLNSPDELLNKLMESMDEYWNRVPTCALEVSKGTVQSGILIAGDNVNVAISKARENTILVGCSTNTTLFPATSAVLARAGISSQAPYRGIVLINNVTSSFANLSERQKLATLAHEVGHAFGLAHSPNSVALMYYSIGGKVQEKMSIDDYDACSYLYPHEGLVSCSSMTLSKPGRKGGGGYGRMIPLSFLITVTVILLMVKIQNGKSCGF